jgi:hypothetical protein
MPLHQGATIPCQSLQDSNSILGRGLGLFSLPVPTSGQGVTRSLSQLMLFLDGTSRKTLLFVSKNFHIHGHIFTLSAMHQRTDDWYESPIQYLAIPSLWLILASFILVNKTSVSLPTKWRGSWTKVSRNFKTLGDGSFYIINSFKRYAKKKTVCRNKNRSSVL